MHFTLTALIDITDNWYVNIDDGLTNAIVFIDFKKAFDTIDHEILLSKLELYGFKGASLKSECPLESNNPRNPWRFRSYFQVWKSNVSHEAG